VDNYPGLPKIKGINLIQKFESHLKSFEIDIKEQEVVRIEKQKALFLIKTKEQEEFLSKTVIVAVGSDPRPLEVPGEKEFIGKGVSYCSVCDAPVFSGKKVIVVGGGNSGLETALDLSKYAKEILVFEKFNKMKADKSLIELAKKNKKIKLFLNREVREIKGETMVQKVICWDSVANKEFEIEVDGVFIMIGTIPATSFLKGLVEFNERDEIKVDFETCQTSCQGIFAAGDANNGRWKQVVVAAAEGARASLAAYEYIIKNGDNN